MLSVEERFALANSKSHPVEAQWHYERMTAAGFVAITKEQVGFVRKYEYSHPAGHTAFCSTGASADYWTIHTVTGGQYGGYPGTLQACLNSL